MNFDQWSLWKRALTLNVLGGIAVLIGLKFANARLSPDYAAPIAVFTLVLLNFGFLVLRARLLAAESEGAPRHGIPEVIANVWRERPIVILLVLLQLLAVSRSATTAVTCFRVSMDVHGMPDASSVAERLALVGVLRGMLVAAFWVLCAVGLWNKRRWAWWLAVLLNGAAAAVSALAQLVSWSGNYRFDTLAALALVLLLLPSVRKQFGGGSNAVANSPAV